MAPGLVEEDGGGISDIEGINASLHGNEDLLIAGGADCAADAFAFGSEDDADIGIESGIRKQELIGVGMGGDATDAGIAQMGKGDGQGRAEKVRDAEDGAHAGSDGAAEVGVGGSFANDERLDAQGGGVPEDESDVDGIGDGVDGGEEAGLGKLEEFLKGGGTWDATEAEDALKKGEAGESGEDVLGGYEEVNGSGVIGEE